jgi:signal transduction histidine kinase/CheY-like chemotaxis protein
LADNANPRDASILVVDDEQIVLSLVEDTLTDDGYDVVTTLSANEAIELVKSHQFDFILTDIRMPEMNGIELVKEIHKISPTAGIIFMTGYANLDTAKQAIKEGAYDYIMKPFELSEIRQAISRAVEQKKSDSEATLSRELDKIADLSNMMYASGDLASLLQLSLSFAIIQSNAEAGIAIYFDRGNEEIVLVHSTKTFDGTEEVSRLEIPAADWDSIQPVKSPILIRDETQHPLFGTPIFQTNRDKVLPERFFALKAAVIVPLIRSEKMLGLASLFHAVPDYRLKSSDTQFLNFISSQLTISLENLQLLEDSREAYRRLEYLQEQTLKMEKMATRGQMSTEIGHELNNYLGVVVANFQLMDLRIQKGVTEGLERFTESINDHLEKISRFAKGLMDYSSLQKATFKTVNINLLLERIVEFLRPQKRFRDFDIDVTSDSDKPESEIDHGLIEQVLYNLLNNAAEASADSETKKIEIKISGQSDDMIRLSIKDHGPGISESKLKKIFREKFTTKESGHGIGLVVCKNIIDKHNGRIAVDSIKGQGTTFTIDLPIKRKVTDEAAVETA